MAQIELRLSFYVLTQDEADYKGVPTEPQYILGVTRSVPVGVRQQPLWWTWIGHRFASFAEMEERAAGYMAAHYQR